MPLPPTVWLSLSATQLTTLAAHATAAGDAALAGILTGRLAERAASADTDAACIAAARTAYGEAGAVEIDDEAVVSHGAHGAYVMAWTFVSPAMCPDAGEGAIEGALPATAAAPAHPA